MASDKPIVLSVKAVICDDKRRVLLLKRSMSSKANAGKWDLPGGKIDSGERIDEALIREIREETSLTVSIEHVAGAAESESPDKRIAYVIFECTVEFGEVQISDEHDEYAWVECRELPSIDIVPQFRPLVQIYCNKNLP